MIPTNLVSFFVDIMLKGNLSRFLPRFFKKMVRCGLTGVMNKFCPEVGASWEKIWLSDLDFFDWVAEAGISIRVRINSSVTNKKWWVKIGSVQRDLESLRTFLSLLLQIWIHYHQSKETENSLHGSILSGGKAGRGEYVKCYNPQLMDPVSQDSHKLGQISIWKWKIL